MSAISVYLDQLERELKARRAPRVRLLAEAGDHLRSSAEEIAASGIDAAAAEEQAVARFGSAVLVANRFALGVATASARRALLWAATACAAYAAAAAYFVLAAPSWLDDFPQGAPSMLGLQVALVALVLSGLRVFRFRSEILADEVRLRFVTNGVVIATAAILLAAVGELVLALTRPAAAPWSDAGAFIVVYAVAGAIALAAVAPAVGAAARASVAAALPSQKGAVVPQVAALVDGVALPWLRARPVLACAGTAGLAFVAMTAVAIVDDGSGWAGAITTGLVEAAAVVAAYLTLGRALGVRARRAG